MTLGGERQFRWYMTGQGLYFAAMGVQGVLFPWLVAVRLQETPERVGTAQMLSTLPLLVLVLFGGALADRRDCRSLLIRLQLLLALPPLGLAALVGLGHLSYGALVVYALAIGALGAFNMPARDTLLTRVAGGDVQGAVTTATGVQFTSQIVGLVLGGLASFIGAAPLLAAQGLAMAAGSFAAHRLSPAPPAAGPAARTAARTADRTAARTWTDIRDGMRLTWQSAAIRPVIVYMFATGLIFLGFYMVVLPLLIRDFYHGGSAAFAVINVCFMSGVGIATFALKRFARIRRQGRAMMLASCGGAVVTLLIHFGLPLVVVDGLCLIWGMTAGVSMTMARTMVQVSAPASHRARILSVYQLAFMGGAPIGSFAMGFVVQQVGVLNAALVPAAGLVVLWLPMFARTGLWRLEVPTAGPD